MPKPKGVSKAVLGRSLNLDLEILMKKLLEQERQEGAIPPNLIIAANTRSSDRYLKACKEHGLEVHPARFVDAIPEFFIKFLTRREDIVLDPFSGSNVVGEVAESLERRWVSIEIDEKYVVGSAFRFDALGEIVYQKHMKRLSCEGE